MLLGHRSTARSGTRTPAYACWDMERLQAHSSVAIVKIYLKDQICSLSLAFHSLCNTIVGTGIANAGVLALAFQLYVEHCLEQGGTSWQAEVAALAAAAKSQVSWVAPDLLQACCITTIQNLLRTRPCSHMSVGQVLISKLCSELTDIRFSA